MKWQAWVGCVVLLLAAISAQAGEVYSVVKATSPIKLDGRIDEPAWETAKSSSPFVWLATVAKPHTPVETWFKLACDDQAMYLAVYCAEPEMDKLVTGRIPVYSNDCVEIFIDPAGKGVKYYQFVVSAGNVQWDANWIESGNTGGPAGHPRWESATFHGKDFWSLEVRIPLTAFMHTRAADFTPQWLFNVARERWSVAWELTTWSPLPKKFHDPASWNKIQGLPGKNPALDLGVMDLKASVHSIDKDKYKSDLTVTAEAGAQAAGLCEIQAFDGETALLPKPVQATLRAGHNEFHVPNVVIANLGRREIRVAIERGGKVLTDMTYLTLFEYQPIRFAIDEPFYRQNFYPGQKVEEVRGKVKVNLADDVLADLHAELTLAGEAMPKPVSLRVPVKDRKAEFSLDAKAMAVGKAMLTCRLLNSKGETVTEQVTDIQRLGEAPGNCVYIDRDLNLVVNGKPRYVRYWNGVAYLVSRKFAEDHPNGTPGNNCWPEVAMGLEAERIDPSDKSRASMDVRPSDAVMEETRKRVLAARTNPNTLWYYLADEPECRDISAVYLRHQYDLVRELDPYHPVMIISRSPAMYVTCADILNPHPYISPMINADGKRTIQYPRMIGQMLREVLTAGEGKIPAWQTPQAFSYAFVNRFAEMPNFQEFRFTAFAGVVAGMKGIMPWTYGPHTSSHDLRIGGDWVMESLADYEPWLLSGQPTAVANVSSPDNSVETWIKTVDGKTLVIAVNVTDKPVTATIQSPAFKGIDMLHGFREQTEAAVSSETIKLDFIPYGVHVLSHPRMGQGLKTAEQVEAELAAVHKADAERGNLLYKRRRDLDVTSSSTYMTGLGMADDMTNGVRDDLAWRRITGQEENPWIQIAFINGFSPRFKTIKAFGVALEGMKVLGWEFGQWTTIAEVPKDHKGYEATITLDQPVDPIKIQLVFPASSKHPLRAELYELELYP
ncbi:MAG: carbohydrate-binding family 9-like protein [Phycisphaeraceae bacterium]|nr:carbohydrate-binding family 9-like protein [Phycisphaeraceae bacterium]